MSDDLVLFLKAIADPTRLNILGLLAEKPRSVIEVAATLDLRPPTISHHLNKLRKVGLVDAKHRQYYSIYTLQPDKLKEYAAMLTPDTLVERVQQSQNVNPSAFEDESLARWIKNNKVTALPSQIEQRDIVLRWLADKFEPDRRYDWDQVGTLVGKWIYWGDPHTLDVTRAERALVDAGLLKHLPDESWYWRADSQLAQEPDFSPAQLPIAESPVHLLHTAVRAARKATDPDGVYASLKEPVQQETDPYHELLKLAVRIRSSKSYTQAQIDELIEKHHGGYPDQVRTAMIKEDLIVQTEDGRYSRSIDKLLP